jgi:hypothetical protein
MRMTRLWFGSCYRWTILGVFAILLQSTTVFGLEQTGNVCTSDSHCLNGGECLVDPDSNQRYCECRQGFTGLKCSHYCPYACKNGGYCTLTPEGTSSTLVSLEPRPEDFMCKCFGLWTGTLCEIPYKNCGHNDRCFNGGICLLDEKLGEHKCRCSSGWTGPTCQAKVDKDSALAKMVESPGGRSGVTIVGLLLISMITALIFMIARRRHKQGEHDEFQNLSFEEEGSTFLDEMHDDHDADADGGGASMSDGVYNSKGLLLNVI